MSEAIANYDPNSRWGTHVVAITLKEWDYERTFEMRVAGNCRGETVLRSAIENLEDDLLLVIERGELVTLERGDGDPLEFDENSEIDVPSMVVSARIIAFEPEPKKAPGEPVLSPAGESA